MNEVSECADSLLDDFKEFASKLQIKETELNKSYDQFDKSSGLLKKHVSTAQNDAKGLYNSIIALKNSVPSDEKFRQCSDENVKLDPGAISLDANLKQPAAREQGYPTSDIERIQSLEVYLMNLTKLLS